MEQSSSAFPISSHSKFRPMRSRLRIHPGSSFRVVPWKSEYSPQLSLLRFSGFVSRVAARWGEIGELARVGDKGILYTEEAIDIVMTTRERYKHRARMSYGASLFLALSLRILYSSFARSDRPDKRHHRNVPCEGSGTYANKKRQIPVNIR